MCIGIPMQIQSLRGDMAVCLYQGVEYLIDLMLVGTLPVGTWVLVFMDTAREVLDETRALQITRALEAMRLAMQGETDLDHLFADLADREPTLPEFLQS